jgi:hypothetical protein
MMGICGHQEGAEPAAFACDRRQTVAVEKVDERPLNDLSGPLGRESLMTDKGVKGVAVFRARP